MLYVLRTRNMITNLPQTRWSVQKTHTPPPPMPMTPIPTSSEKFRRRGPSPFGSCARPRVPDEGRYYTFDLSKRDALHEPIHRHLVTLLRKL